MTRNASSAPEQERLILVPIPLPPSFPDLDRAIQRSFGDLERPANLHNGMSSIVEILGNTQMSAGEDFGPVACPSEDMEDQFSAAGCGINVLGQTFEANASLLKSRHCGYEVGEGAT